VSRFDRLTARLCPDGAPFHPLSDLLKYEQPGKYLVSSTSYNDNNPTPVLTAGQTFVLGYTNETDGIYSASPESPVVIFDDFTTAFKWVDFPFKAKSSAMKMLTIKKSDKVASLKFIYYAMQTIWYEPQDHARQWIGTYSQFRIPVPPIEVQQEIVRILDSFMLLETTIQSERQARQAQYLHYRDLLLTFPKEGEVRRPPMGELTSSISSGRNKARSTEGEYPVYGSTGLLGFSSSRGYSGDALLVARVGANAGLVNMVTGDFDVSDNTLVVRPLPEWDVRFAYHQIAHMDLNQYAVGGGQPLVTGGLLKALEVPVPPIKEQRRIASILDNFHALVDELSAELGARRKQYAHYRDRLLSFKEAAA
jgi:type I restriction enzyme S subunit